MKVERTQSGGPVAYLLNYKFKLPTMTDVQMMTRQAGEQRSMNTTRDNFQNDICLYMRARDTVSVEAAWSLF